MKETASIGTMRPDPGAPGAQTEAEPDGLDAVSDRAAPGGANTHEASPEESVWSHAPARERPPSAERPITRPRLDPEAKVEGGPQTARSHDRTSSGWLRRHLLAVVLSLLFLLIALPVGYIYLDYTARFETTDDAFIAARQLSIAPQVSGYVTAVPVTDNQHVDAGGVIARIDDREYRAALEQAQAGVAAAQAQIQNDDAQITVQQATVAEDQAKVDEAQAALVFAQQQAARYVDLAHTGYGTVQNAQQYTSALTQQQAAVKTAQATVESARRQIAALKAQRASDEAKLGEAKAQRDQAALNLSYTTITAAQPGQVVQLSAAVGEYAQPGTVLTMFVPDDIWVTANFKETQLDEMRPGQPATLEIDAYPERRFRGRVASVQPGSGPAFSLLPPENATGNYVKIVQRVPVKIIIDKPPTDVALGPGMSVQPSVRVDPTPSLYERLEGRP
jgi:membrane fusion protein (multidrug efflux system)